MELMERIGAKVPVVFFDTDLPSARRMAYVGQDSETGGRLAARLLGLAAQARNSRQQIPGEVSPVKKFVIVAPNAQNDHLDHRIRGFRENINAPVEMCIVNVQSDHDTGAFRKALNDSINTDTAGIFVIDASAHFVAEYLSSHYDSSDDSPVRPPLLGFDLVPGNRKWMEEGIIDFLLTQRPVDQGAKCVRRLFGKIFQDESGEEHEYMPIDIITIENLKYLKVEEVL